jgi:hypothetical protein
MATTTINLGLSLDGLSNVDSTGKNNGDILRWNSTTNKWEDDALPTTAPAGLNGQIQFNNSGAFGADSLLVWDNTNKRLGVGATPSTSVRLDVRAQGVLSTDVAFRVRNASDTADIIRVQGNGNIAFNGTNNVPTGTFIGEGAGNNASGANSTFIGTGAGSSTTTGASNTFIGTSAGQANTIASDNTFIGTSAGSTISSGGQNVSIGRISAIQIIGGGSLTNAANSTFIGYGTRAANNAQTNQIVIGHTAIGAGSNTTTIGNTSITAAHIRGAVICGDTVALATNATNGFLYIPTCAGVPTGTPTAVTGKAAMVADTTGNKLYVYLGGAWVAMN